MAKKQAGSEKIQLTGKRKLPISGKLAKDPNVEEAAIAEMMQDARYLRQSATVIQESLQNGFDVLQLPNGDIVTTGTKTIVYQYTWDEERAKLIRTKKDTSGNSSRKSSSRTDIEQDDLVAEEA